MPLSLCFCIVYSVLNRFIESFPDYLIPIIKFAFHTGFRLNTILKLRKSAYNPETNEVTILKQYAKNKKQQIFPLSGEAVKILEVNLNNDNEYVFPNLKTGKPYDNFQFSFKKAVEKAGLHPDTTFHTIRRSFGTILVREGNPIKTVSIAMGHSSITVTERYLRISKDKDIKPMINGYGKRISSEKEVKGQKRVVNLKKWQQKWQQTG